MPTSLSTIDIAKEQSATYKPLLVYTVTFSDGTVLRLSSDPLNVAEGGYQYGGNNYLARVMDQDISAVQALAEGGIDVIPSLTLHLADADCYLWLNYELTKGFKGATVQATFIFWDVNTTTFSSDSIVKYTGICGQPASDELKLVIPSTSKLNMTKVMLPNVPIQKRCPWVNPDTVAKRALAGNSDSIYYECGETRDLTTAPPCNNTTATCTQLTRRGNITYTPPPGGRTREYISGQWADVKSNNNETKYGDYAPLVYGTAWVSPPLLNSPGDGNYTRGECLLSFGEIGYVFKCVVNGTELMAATDIDGTPYTAANKDLRFHIINKGDRDGSPNLDIPYNGNGDPYGSLAVLYWVVPRKLATTDQTPNIQVLIQGRKVRVYTDTSTYTLNYSNNPSWVLLDVLIQAGYTYAELDLQSFIDVAAYADQTISYTDQNGATVSHKRYQCNLVIRQRRSASDVVRAIRQSANLHLIPNKTSGKLALLAKSTLAKQQPSAMAGSNYSTAVSSVLPNGTSTNGYVAYKFTAAGIIRRGGVLQFKVLDRPLTDQPNRVQFSFADEDYDYASSNFLLIDSEDVGRINQEVGVTLNVDGVPNFDQGARLAKTYLAETHRGNPNASTQGTMWIEIETSFKGVRLEVGQIVMVDLAKRSISNQLFRVMRISPAANFETVKLTLAWHSDTWYLDTYGQTANPRYTGAARDRLERPAFPWCPNNTAPQGSDSLFSASDKTFSITPDYSERTADGRAIVKLVIGGKVPVNEFNSLTPPMLGQQGTTATSGGALLGSRVYYAVVCAEDSDGLLSAPSRVVCRVDVTSGGNSNTITIPIGSWDPSTVGFRLFAGYSPNRMTFQTSGSGTPSSVTITAFNENSYGQPDVEFDRIKVLAKRVIHSGVFGAVADTVGTNTLKVTGSGWTTNQWAGYDVSVVAIDDNTEIPLANFRVSSNSADTLTVSPNPAAIPLADGVVIVMRSKPTVTGSGTIFTDANWVNSTSGGGLGLTVGAEVGNMLRIFAGAGRGQARRIIDNTSTSITVDSEFETTPDSTSRYIVEEPNWLQDVVVTTPQSNTDPNADISITIPVDNYQAQVLLIKAFAIDGGGNEAVESLSPEREVYVVGSATVIGNSDGFVEMVTTAGAVTPDLADGLNQQETMTGDVTINDPIFTGGTIVAGMWLDIKLIEDSTGGRKPTFSSIFIGLANIDMDLTPDTYSIFSFVYNTAGKWEYRGGVRGASIT